MGVLMEEEKKTMLQGISLYLINLAAVAMTENLGIITQGKSGFLFVTEVPVAMKDWNKNT